MQQPTHSLSTPFPRSVVFVHTDVPRLAAELAHLASQPPIRQNLSTPCGASVSFTYRLRAYALQGTACGACGLQACAVAEHATDATGRHRLRFMACQDGHWSDMGVDHIIPRADGGASAPGNLRVLCRACNGRKASARLFKAIPKYRISEVRNRFQATYPQQTPGLAAYEAEFLERFMACRSFDDGFLDASAMSAYLDVARVRHGLTFRGPLLMPYHFPGEPLDLSGSRDRDWLLWLQRRLVDAPIQRIAALCLST